jgi:hypothetical protein
MENKHSACKDIATGLLIFTAVLGFVSGVPLLSSTLFSTASVLSILNLSESEKEE